MEHLFPLFLSQRAISSINSGSAELWQRTQNARIGEWSSDSAEEVRIRQIGLKMDSDQRPEF